jgi:putative endonuclease
MRWFVYLIRCGDGALYAGITTDVSRRLEEHRGGAGRGAKYLRGRAPLRLAASRAVGGRALALRVEHRIKRLSKSRKEALIGQAGRLEALVAEARRNAVSRGRPRRSKLQHVLGARLDRPRQTI